MSFLCHRIGNEKHSVAAFSQRTIFLLRFTFATGPLPAELAACEKLDQYGKQPVKI